MAFRRSVSKTLIKYNLNDLEEKDEVEKKLIDIEFNEQIANAKMMKMLLALNGRIYKEKTSIALLNLTD